MKQYLAIMANGRPDNNIMFYEKNFKDASRYLKTQVKDGTMFQNIKLLELDTMKSKTYMFKN